MIFVLAVLCSVVDGSSCRTVEVTSSEVGDITMMSCAIGAPLIAEWVTREHPSERLQSWRCVMGRRGSAA